MQRTRTLALFLATLGLLSASTLAWNALSQRGRRAFDERYDRLRAQVADAAPRAEPGEAARALVLRARELADELQRRAPAEEFLYPDLASLPAAARADAAAWIATLEPWLAAADGLFAELDGLPAGPLGAADETPRILRLRYLTNVVGLDAVVHAGHRERDETSARRLAGVLDLARLEDDGTVMSALVLHANEGRLLCVVRAVLDAGVEPGPLRAALDGRLARSGASADLAARVRHELDEGLLGRLRRGEVEPDEGDGWDDLATSLGTYERALAAARRGQRERVDSPADAGAALVDSFELFRGRAALARVALAVHAHHAAEGTWPASLEHVASAFEDGLPLDPGTGLAFPYRTTEDGALLGPAAWTAPAVAATESAFFSGDAWAFGDAVPEPRADRLAELRRAARPR